MQRSDSSGLKLDDVQTLYDKCQGNLVRVHEELLAEGTVVAYSTLTHFCRSVGLGTSPPLPSGHYDFAPGQEMQHDTSPHRVSIAGIEHTVQTAGLVLCFSRMKFIQCYPHFTRFYCKAFLTEALKYLNGACKTCMIDNTHVVVLHGSGHTMVPVSEMEAFSERFGFEFKAHRIGHANRSAHVERNFDHVERNFLVGRTFASWEDLNAQARAWCDKINATPKRALKAKPVDVFAHERLHLAPLPPYVPEVYQLHERMVDVEGNISLHSNRYSVPYQLIGRRVQVKESLTHVEISDHHDTVATHVRLWDACGHRVLSPSHRPARFQPKPVHPDESALKAAPELLQQFMVGFRKHWPHRAITATRALLRMWNEYPHEVMLLCISEANHYGMFDLLRLERMILRRLGKDFFPGDPNG